MSNVLELVNVTRAYAQGGTKLEVLKQASLTLKRGEMVALVGPSGSGKTTLLQITGLLDTPTGGQVTIAGQNLTGATDAVRTQARKNLIGFVYQFHHLLPDFSALENIVLPQLIAGHSRTQAEARANELLAQMKLSERTTHRPAQLSGGEQQRVAIARALSMKPALILADEPTGNLDPETAEEVFAYLRSTARDAGVTALVATHNMELAKRMDRIVTLRAGKMIEG
jgi:lipoprotein-releasing system ATP-binding protein